jgi:protoporphyrinogen oxidase
MKPFSRNALIIGAGPAGLTAAYELLMHTDIKPVLVDTRDVVGGLSATHQYRGNRIDVGGHRFFSRDPSILSWWNRILPLQSAPSIDDLLLRRDRSALHGPGESDPERTDSVMLARDRLSRIYFRRRLFDYPLKLSFDTFRKLGAGLDVQIGCDYLLNRLHPIRLEKNLEDFFINRFGRKLYETFFKSYTEKVWGVSCREIGAEWGRQRVKGVSIGKLIRHALLARKRCSSETSLIRHFYYPKLGAGQMWEEVARRIVVAGGEIYVNTTICEVIAENLSVKKVVALSRGRQVVFSPDVVFSSMPLKDLMTMLTPFPPAEVRAVSDNLIYRDFIMTGIIAKTMCQGKVGPVYPGVRLLPDTWIYLQEPDVISGRLQIYNNWSPYMAASRDCAWIGLEFFCNEGDGLWSKSGQAIVQTAADELNAMNLVAASDIIDGVCIKTPKAYPAYWGAYAKLDTLKKYLCSFSNLLCIGRNGLHRYNNMDHSMLSAILSVKAMCGGQSSRESIWDIDPDSADNNDE